jgi:hypothetical protein
MKKFVTFALALFCLSAVAQSPMLLSNVRKVFIEKMDNNLDQYLASSISSKFHGSLTVVLDRSSADAILKGANLTAQETQKATVQLVDKAGSTVLWSGSANDRSMMTLDLKHGGEKKLADHLISELKKAMQP